MSEAKTAAWLDSFVTPVGFDQVEALGVELRQSSGIAAPVNVQTGELSGATADSVRQDQSSYIGHLQR